MQMPGAGDDLMELRSGRGGIVMNGIERRLEYGIVGHERGELRIGMVAGML
jgi:hypothetical protein